MPQSAEMRVPETRLSSADKPAIVTGKVTSAEDGLPLPGVSVLIKGSTIGTQTDAKGRYTLPAISKNQTLIYTFIGLQPTEVSIPSNYVVADTTQVNVKMEADATALSEVVVTGYGTARKTETEESTFEYAHPVTGNREFKKYLSENLVYPQEAKDKRVEGNVVIEFTIDVNGQPGNFKTIRAIGHGCEEELIRLIQHGPKWIATHRNGTPESDQVRVRFKFELPKK